MSDELKPFEYRAFSLEEVRKLKPIPSGYETDRIFLLQRERLDGVTRWALSEERLASAFRKEYDAGSVDDWLESYEGQAAKADLRFMGAMVEGEVKALATYCSMQWNDTIWLIDIRTEKAARRSGIGSALVREVQQLARKEKVRGISVETQTNNYPAIRFYRKHGFVISGFDDHLYTNGDVQRQDVAVFLFWENGL